MSLYRSWMIVAGFVLAFLPLNQAKADVIWEQSLNPNLSGSFSELNGQEMADNFPILGINNTTLENLTWYGRYQENISPSADFTIRIFTESSGTISTSPTLTYNALNITPSILTDTYTIPGTTPIVVNWLEYSTPLPGGWMFSPDTYWLSVIESDGDTASQWLWGHDAQGNAAHRGSSDPAWTIASRPNQAFILYGSSDVIPEPTSLLLLGTGLGILWLGVNRRRRK